MSFLYHSAVLLQGTNQKGKKSARGGMIYVILQWLIFFALTSGLLAIHRSVLIEASMTGTGDSFIVRPNSPFFEHLGLPFRQLDLSLDQERWIS